MRRIYIGAVPKHGSHRRAVLNFRNDGSPYIMRPFAPCDCISLVKVAKNNWPRLISGIAGLIAAGVIALSVYRAH